jgi:hypothetical protein
MLDNAESFLKFLGYNAGISVIHAGVKFHERGLPYDRFLHVRDSLCRQLIYDDPHIAAIDGDLICIRLTDPGYANDDMLRPFLCVVTHSECRNGVAIVSIARLKLGFFN